MTLGKHFIVVTFLQEHFYDKIEELLSLEHVTLGPERSLLEYFMRLHVPRV